ncbi:hypothetical protein [Dyella nitratireducens]|uniref:Glycosyltransferase RgtA/B/C/D-like domain-containing protein n=1 Tax=Dyella nitratireducens TaxID=1849580 RepID=A0ABQ1FJV8_9GAMM|nr:hypothetical protein [Dyella nitratireducens]GGA17690.1 hypothetical protein GCM10010981_01820 [Dyella nitratireducens]GLQ44756.1 hypothetical protein GCM10007902_46060 [Dyella nitratireducens]
MIWNYTYGFCVTILFAWLLGYPVAVWCGLGRGVRALGYASASGASLLLIACRGVQMIAPIGAARWPLLAGFAAGVVIAWSRRSTRSAAAELLSEHGRGLAGLLCGVAAIGVLLGVPILFSNAIQFDGTRNADSFIYVSSARYMLAHSFYGAPDFTPEHPVYTISRSYFGDGAMQPRPAAEGLLAWLSALRGTDPMYLYNAVQAAGVMLAGLAALAFLPVSWKARHASDWALLAVYALAGPTLLHVATNSNFANGFNLPAATGYVALGLLPRSRGTFVSGVLFIGCLLSGYPELLVFAAAARGFAVVCDGIASRTISKVVREAAWMSGELIVAGVVLPWAAWGAIAVFRTTLGVSQAGASELGGNMYAGLPMFVAAAIALGIAWRPLASVGERGHRSFLVGILVAFAVAQLVMVARGFGYGGFKISEYFLPLLVGVMLRSVISAPSGVRLGRVAAFYAVAVAALLTVKSADVLRRAWEWSEARRVTPDLVNAGKALVELAHGRPVAMGTSPQPFYYGMWIPYLASVPIAYDLQHDPDAAGYLSPYLHTTARTAELYGEAQLQVDVGVGNEHMASAAIAQFGRVVIRPKQEHGI